MLLSWSMVLPMRFTERSCKAQRLRAGYITLEECLWVPRSWIWLRFLERLWFLVSRIVLKHSMYILLFQSFWKMFSVCKPIANDWKTCKSNCWGARLPRISC